MKNIVRMYVLTHKYEFLTWYKIFKSPPDFSYKSSDNPLYAYIILNDIV